MDQFAKDRDFHSAHTMRTPDHVQLKGKDVEVKVGDGKAIAYWVAPKAGQTQTILMIHEWWGLNENIRQSADLLHEKTGYGVMAADLYEGKVAKNAEEAAKYMSAVNEQSSSKTVNAAIKALKSGFQGSKPSQQIGTIGFCFGGGWSHKSAIMGGEAVKACVIFYGLPTVAPAELERLSAPVLMIWPNKDKWINKEVVDGFRDAMKNANKSLQVEEFDADHAFANPTSKSFKDQESKEAWSKTLQFFKKNLG